MRPSAQLAHRSTPTSARRDGQRHPTAQGGQRARPFGNGDLKLLLLALIAEFPSHGYELIRSIEDRMGGGYSPSPGIVYPTLTLLEETGLLTAEADGAKRLYRITQDGRAHLDANADAVARLNARIAAFEASSGGGRSGPITRALENLKLAVRMRTNRPLTDEQIAAIRTVLDSGATAIEQT